MKLIQLIACLLLVSPYTHLSSAQPTIPCAQFGTYILLITESLCNEYGFTRSEIPSELDDECQRRNLLALVQLDQYSTQHQLDHLTYEEVNAIVSNIMLEFVQRTQLILVNNVAHLFLRLVKGSDNNDREEAPTSALIKNDRHPTASGLLATLQKINKSTAPTWGNV